MYNQTIYKFVNHINWLENYNKSDKMKKNILIFWTKNQFNLSAY